MLSTGRQAHAAEDGRCGGLLRRGKFGLVVEKCLQLAKLLDVFGPAHDVEAQDIMARLTLDVVLISGFGIASDTLGSTDRAVPLLKELHYAMDESFR
jgi:hypothetical protein